MVAFDAGGSDSDRESDADSPLALYKGEPSGDDALLTGTLVHEGPCLYVDSGRERTSILFSEQVASWRDGTLYFGEDRARPGDRVGLGGGGASALSNFDWARPPDEACDISSIWVSGDQIH